jgi:putative nucleotidyltransferase with HDIG domain
MIPKEIVYALAMIHLLLFINMLFVFLKSKSRDFLFASFFLLSGALYLLGQFHLGFLSNPPARVFWLKVQYIGIFSAIFTFPLFTISIMQKREDPRIMLGLGTIAIIAVGLIAFTDLIIRDWRLISTVSFAAGKGMLYPLFPLIGIVSGIYYHFQIIIVWKNKTHLDVNFLPAIIGVGIGVLFGAVDVGSIVFCKPISAGMLRPLLIAGISIISFSFAWTFLSQYASIFFALQKSKLTVEQLTLRKDRSLVEFVSLIAKTIDAKDHYTAGHALRVMDYAIRIARACHLPDSEIEILTQAALLHDIGKISIPDGILNKRSELTAEERKHIYQHPVVAKRILSTVRDFENILEIIYSHHERVDGKGYPDGKLEEEIPLLSRIIAVADSYDAMRSERPYREAMSQKEAIQELERVKGKQLDETIVDSFINIISTT